MAIWIIGKDAESARVGHLLEGKESADLLIILDLSCTDKLQKSLTAKKIRIYLTDHGLLEKITRIDFYTSNMDADDDMCGIPELADQTVSWIYDTDHVAIEARYVTSSSAVPVKLIAPSAENGNHWQAFDEKGGLFWSGEDLNLLLQQEGHCVKPFALTYPSLR